MPDSRGQSVGAQRLAAVVTACACALLVGCAEAPRSEYSAVIARSAQITPGGQVSFNETLAPGAYSVLVTEDGIDIAAELTIGDRHRHSHDPTPRHGVHLTYISVDAPTALSVAARSIDHRTKTGKVALEILQWKRAAGTDPSALEQGDAAFSVALTSEQPVDDFDWERALVSLRSAVDYYARAKESQRSGLAYYTLANALYFRMSEWAKAEDSAGMAETNYRKFGDMKSAARAASLLAANLLERANELSSPRDRSTRDQLLKRADSTLERAANELSGDSLNLDATAAVNLRGIGRWYARDFDGAREFFLAALSDAASANDQATEANVLGNLAWLDYVSGRSHEAADEYARLLTVLEPQRQSNLYATHVANYALVLASLGEFDRAIALHTEVLDLAATMRDEAMRARQLVAIGALNLQRGESGQALTAARTALDLPDGLRERTQFNAALRLAGNAAMASSDYASANKYFSQLLDRALDEGEAARARVLLAGSFRGQGRSKQAAEQLAQALSNPDEWVQAQGLVERARLHMQGGRDADAAADLRAADRLFTALGLDAPRIETATLLARALIASGDARGALAAADSGIAIVSTIRARSANPKVRARFLASRYGPFEAKVAALLQLGHDSPDSQWLAMTTAEAARSQTLSELLATRATRSSTIDPDLQRARDRLVAQQLLLERRLSRAAADDPAVVEIRRDIQETQARLGALQGKSTRVATESAASRSSARLQTLRAGIPRDAAIAYFFVGELHSQLWLISQHELQHRQLPGREAIVEEMRRLAMPQQPSAPQPAGRTSSSNAIDEIAAALAASGAKRLTIVPDGPLADLPFAALQVAPETGRAQRLIERAVLSYAPSLTQSLGAASARSTASRQTTVAIVSDPVYARDDVRLAAVNSAGTTLRDAQAPDLLRLPYSGAEARAVRKNYASARVLALDGPNANAAAVANLPFAQLDVLHLAAHAVARDDDPSLSAVYLSAYDSRGLPMENSALTAEKVLQLGMRAELVVLSGCSTAGGTPLAGEGMLGLTHSFLANGSGAVLASLWAVDDAETARFIGDFYEAYSKGFDAAESLALAQRKWIAQSPQPDSWVTWATFVVRQGRVLDIKKGGGELQ